MNKFSLCIVFFSFPIFSLFFFFFWGGQKTRFCPPLFWIGGGGAAAPPPPLPPHFRRLCLPGTFKFGTNKSQYTLAWSTIPQHEIEGCELGDILNITALYAAVFSCLLVATKRNTDQWAFTKHRVEGFSRHNSLLVGRKNQAKFENDCISRNGHRIKITHPNLMILVSFSSGEDAISNDI